MGRTLFPRGEPELEEDGGLDEDVDHDQRDATHAGVPLEEEGGGRGEGGCGQGEAEAAAGALPLACPAVCLGPKKSTIYGFSV